jgi:hypothetical protein
MRQRQSADTSKTPNAAAHARNCFAQRSSHAHLKPHSAVWLASTFADRAAPEKQETSHPIRPTPAPFPTPSGEIEEGGLRGQRPWEGGGWLLARRGLFIIISWRHRFSMSDKDRPPGSLGNWRAAWPERSVAEGPVLGTGSSSWENRGTELATAGHHEGEA